MAEENEDSIQVYPCVIYKLSAEENPIAFKRGFQFRIEDIDGDNWYFRDKERMLEQLQIHAMHAVIPAEMKKARTKRLKQK